MKKEEFFARLFGSLVGLETEELERVKEYYVELLLDGMEEGRSEEEVIAHFGLPEGIAEKIWAEQSVKQGGQTFSGDTQDYPVNGVYRPAGDISGFRIFAQDVEIRIRPALDGQFKLHYQKSPREEITVEEAGRCYTFRQRIPLMSRILFLWPIRRVIIVEVPEGKIQEFEVVTSNASVKVERMEGFRRGRLHSSNAKISVSGMKGKRLECETSNGSIKITDCDTDVLDVCTFNGKIVCSKCRSAHTARLKTSNAEIGVNELESPDIRLKSSNGNLKGTICGELQEYMIDAGTSNGFCNLSNQKDRSYRKKLYAHTSNASIHIDFLF